MVIDGSDQPVAARRERSTAAEGERDKRQQKEREIDGSSNTRRVISQSQQGERDRRQQKKREKW